MKKNILIIAPHPDDETLGVGGTIAKFITQGYKVFVLIVSGHLPPLYTKEAYIKTVREAEAAFKILGVEDFFFFELPPTLISDTPIHILNKKICDIIEKVDPKIVFTCFPDRHIDHKLVFDSVMVATRPVGFGTRIEIVAAYETLSETHWNAPNIEANFTPNWVIDISDFIEVKLKALACYESQIPTFPGSRSIKAVESLAIFRGSQSGFGYGEAFQIIRMKG
jgi:LmbE family N-acetylglucosaminyl deacetylase